MRRRWRIWRVNPNANVRLAWIAVAGAALAGLLSGGASPLLNIAGLILVAATAWYEGRYADAVAEFWPQVVRRGAIMRLALGLAMLAGGVALTWVIDNGGRDWIGALASGAWFGGLALILGASARYLMSDGARYAGRKLQERLDDDY